MSKCCKNVEGELLYCIFIEAGVLYFFSFIQGGAVLPNTADLYFAPIKSDGYYEAR